MDSFITSVNKIGTSVSSNWTVVNDLLSRGTVDGIYDWIYEQDIPNIYEY